MLIVVLESSVLVLTPKFLLLCHPHSRPSGAPAFARLRLLGISLQPLGVVDRYPRPPSQANAAYPGPIHDDGRCHGPVSSAPCRLLAAHAPSFGRAAGCGQEQQQQR